MLVAVKRIIKGNTVINEDLYEYDGDILSRSYCNVA